VSASKASEYFRASAPSLRHANIVATQFRANANSSNCAPSLAQAKNSSACLNALSGNPKAISVDEKRHSEVSLRPFSDWVQQV